MSQNNRNSIINPNERHTENSKVDEEMATENCNNKVRRIDSSMTENTNEYTNPNLNLISI